VAEIAAAWVGLTPERRNLVLAFVADQEVLSRLDRMPRPPGRYLAQRGFARRRRRLPSRRRAVATRVENCS
jgi:hypothetical protein